MTLERLRSSRSTAPCPQARLDEMHLLMRTAFGAGQPPGMSLDTGVAPPDTARAYPWRPLAV